MNKSDAINELAAALANAQGEMDAALMDTKNQFGGFFADLGSVMQAAKKPLASNGLSVSQHPELTDGHVTLSTLLMHSSGQWLESSISAPIGDNRALSAAQQAGIVITYLRRYAYAAIVGIYADQDTDGAKVETTAKNGKVADRPMTPSASNAIDPSKAKPIQAPIPPTNGNGHAPAPVNTELTQAMNLLNSKNVKYGDIDTSTLANMVNAMVKADQKPETTDEEKAEHAVKIKAARMIMASRVNQQ